MRKLHVMIIGVVTATVFGGAALAGAATDQPTRPAWVEANGRTNFSKMPDNAKIPYVCWSGKQVVLDGKTAKKMMVTPPMPGTPEHAAGMAKSKELEKSPGVKMAIENGRRIMNIDDSSPDVQRIMKKYEAKEVLQCQ